MEDGLEVQAASPMARARVMNKVGMIPTTQEGDIRARLRLIATPPRPPFGFVGGGRVGGLRW